MPRYEVGRKASAPEIPEVEQQRNDATSNSYEGLHGDALAEKYMRDREEYEKRSFQRKLADIDSNIKRLEQTILQLERMDPRNPSPAISKMREARDKLVRQKVELTNGSQLQDAVVDAQEYKEQVMEKHRNGEISTEEALEVANTDNRDLNEKLKQNALHKTYRYEEVFHENIDGDLIMTFPEEVLEKSGLKVGDNLGLSVVNGSLVIKKL